MNRFILASFLLVLFASFTIEIRGENEQFKNVANSAFVILSQPDKHHTKLAKETKKNLEESLKLEKIDSVPILVVGEEIPLHGSWTIFPIITHLSSKMKLEKTWFIFLDVASNVNLMNLERVLKSHKEDHFVGYALEDKSHTIIHHFSDPKDLKYPDFGASFVLSGSLVKELGHSLAEFGPSLDWLPKDFSIDASYELAKAIKARDKRHILSHEPDFCIKEDKNCAIFPRPNVDDCKATEESAIKLSRETLFAVKTCKKYHDERLPIIQETWAKAALNVMYFSETEDSKYGTVQLRGVKNTERGHCHKTMEIVNFFNEMAPKKGWKWLVIADDDTIMSVQKMLEYLHCFDHEKPIHLGQRYGYRVMLGTHGYDYVTGGGGMIISQELASRMMQKSANCACPNPDSPDDMHLGICMSNLGLILTHSPRFHQARPEDYPGDLLAHQDPISFHKFWNTDPRKMYDQWFRQADQNLKSFKSNLEHPIHQEL